MAALRTLIRRRSVRRGAAVVAAVGAIAALGSVPMTSASFTATTGSSGSSFAAAASFCATPGSVTTSVTNDTMVVESTPTANHEGTAPLMVRAKNGDVRRMFVRPVLPSRPARCTLAKAVLRFSVASYTARTYEVYRVGAAWNISTINWNNQPAPTGTPSVADTAAGTFSIDVTDQVQGLYDFGNNGLTMRDQTENTGQTFTNSYNSINNGNAPVVTYTWA